MCRFDVNLIQYVKITLSEFSENHESQNVVGQTNACTSGKIANIQHEQTFVVECGAFRACVKGL